MRTLKKWAAFAGIVPMSVVGFSAVSSIPASAMYGQCLYVQTRSYSSSYTTHVHKSYLTYGTYTYSVASIYTVTKNWSDIPSLYGASASPNGSVANCVF
jgi:hypothetical protein